MMAMQYRIPLPADYDLRIIERRIAERGHLTDQLPGLAFKAYLYSGRDEARPGSQNLYAPFYLWRDPAGMHDFLSGAGFAAVSAAFGRPNVQPWLAWQSAVGDDLSGARHAIRQITPLSRDRGLGIVREQEERWVQTTFENGALATVAAFDPASWQLLRLSLWKEPRSEDSSDTESYLVGRVSRPTFPLHQA